MYLMDSAYLFIEKTAPVCFRKKKQSFLINRTRLKEDTFVKRALNELFFGFGIKHYPRPNVNALERHAF